MVVYYDFLFYYYYFNLSFSGTIFKQIWKISPMAMALSVFVCLYVCLLQSFAQVIP